MKQQKKKLMESEETTSPTDIPYAVMRKKEVQKTNFPMSPNFIAKNQQKDGNSQKKVKENTRNRYNTKFIEGVALIVREDIICVPPALQEHKVAWYHEYLAHSGINRTELTIRRLFIWTRLKYDVENNILHDKLVCSCDKSQIR
jgi:Integrase zinc binding domain